MIGVLLAAGLGIRLRPLTHITSKVFLPVYNQPMFFYGLKTLIDSGITEIIIVSNPDNKRQLKSLLNYFEFKDKHSLRSSDLKPKVEFVVQKQPRGMVDGLISAKKLIGKSSIMVYPGDNISSVNYAGAIRRFKNGATAFLTKVRDPSKYGCPVYSDDGKLVQIREKPEQPQSNWVVTAPYLFDNKVFELAEILKPSERGEFEITDLLNLYLNEGSLNLSKNSGKWFDCGSFEDLLLAGEYVRRNQKRFFS